MLSDRGYHTGIVRKWHHGHNSSIVNGIPRTPHPRFDGKSGMGPRGDVIVEADWCVGEFLRTLEEEGLLENTLIIFSSDNGPVLNDGYHDDAVKLGDHTPWGPLREGNTACSKPEHASRSSHTGKEKSSPGYRMPWFARSICSHHLQTWLEVSCGYLTVNP